MKYIFLTLFLLLSSNSYAEISKYSETEIKEVITVEKVKSLRNMKNEAENLENIIARKRDQANTLEEKLNALKLKIKDAENLGVIDEDI